MFLCVADAYECKSNPLLHALKLKAKGVLYKLVLTLLFYLVAPICLIIPSFTHSYCNEQCLMLQMKSIYYSYNPVV